MRVGRRKRKWWLWLAGLPLIVWAAAYWGMYFYVKYRMDNWIFSVASHMHVSYQLLETNLDGTILVSGIKIIPLGQSDAIGINRIQVQMPSVLELVKQYNPVTGVRGGAPFHLRVQVDNLHVNLTPRLTKVLDEQQRQYLVGEDKPLPDICEAGGVLTLGQLKALGYKRLQLNLNAFYRYSRPQKSLWLELHSDLKGLWDFALKARIEGVRKLTGSSIHWLAASLSELYLNNKIYPALGKGISRYCAQKAGLSLASYEWMQADALLRALEQKGIVLGKGLRDLVFDYITNWGRLEIQMKPKPPLGLFALGRIKTENLHKRLGLKLTVNNRQIKDLRLGLEKAGPPGAQQAAQKQLEKKPKVTYVWAYRLVSMAALKNYLDHRVRLTTTDGITHEGLLTEVGDKQVSIRKMVRGGSFIAHIPKIYIETIQVRMRIQKTLQP